MTLGKYDEWIELSTTPNLKSLHLGPGNTRKSPDSPFPFSRFHELSYLKLEGETLLDADFRELATARSLRCLRLDNCRFRLSALAQLNKTQSLNQLTVTLSEDEAATLDKFNPRLELRGFNWRIQPSLPDGSYDACKKYGDALRLYANNPGDIALTARAAWAHCVNENRQLATELAGKVLGSPEATLEDQAWAHLVLGRIQLEREDFSGAAKQFQNYLAKRPISHRLGPQL